jgi:hypothetical protein
MAFLMQAQKSDKALPLQRRQDSSGQCGLLDKWYRHAGIDRVGVGFGLGRRRTAPALLDMKK